MNTDACLDDNELTRAERALAALREAARVCAECGVDLRLGSVAYLNGASDVVALAVSRAEAAVESARRRALRIEIGAPVTVRDPHSKLAPPKTLYVLRVGRDLVHLAAVPGGDVWSSHDINGGNTRGVGSGTIDADDLARIRRDLGKRSKGAGAP